MATVTGYTAERMKEIEDESINDASLSGDNLILHRRDGTPINVGPVVGGKGDPGPPGGMVGGYSEPRNALGNVSGTVNLNLDTHNVWYLTPTGAITFAFQNLPASGFVTPGTIVIANSFHAITWPGICEFPNGVPPLLSGLTLVSILAESAKVMVGTSWSEVG